MKKLFLLLPLLVFSCRQTKPPVVSPQPEEPVMHQVVYSLEVEPADKYQGFISFINEHGKPDSVLTSKPWVYEFEAKPGTTLKVKVAARPINPQERARGTVTFKIFVDGNTLESGFGKVYTVEHKLQ